MGKRERTAFHDAGGGEERGRGSGRDGEKEKKENGDGRVGGCWGGEQRTRAVEMRYFRAEEGRR